MPVNINPEFEDRLSRTNPVTDTDTDPVTDTDSVTVERNVKGPDQLELQLRQVRDELKFTIKAARRRVLVEGRNITVKHRRLANKANSLFDDLWFFIDER